MFLNPNFFSNLNSNCSNLLDMRNLQEQVKKHSVTKNLLWTFTVRTNCSSDLKIFCKFSAFSLEFQKFFTILKCIGSIHLRFLIPDRLDLITTIKKNVFVTEMEKLLVQCPTFVPYKLGWKIFWIPKDSFWTK